MGEVEDEGEVEDGSKGQGDTQHFEAYETPYLRRYELKASQTDLRWCVIRVRVRVRGEGEGEDEGEGEGDGEGEGEGQGDGEGEGEVSKRDTHDIAFS